MSERDRGRLKAVLPVAVSLALSAAFIIRSAVTLGGRRAYLLFDDATISMDYARNLADGHGLVWNAGQPPVEGYSNLLWTLWMAVIELAHPTDRLAALGVMLSGALLLAANVYLVTRIASCLAPASRSVPVLAGLAAALYYALTSWTLAGMETGLIAFLYSAAALCALRACGASGDGRRGRLLFGCGGLLALATLTRDDAIVVAFVVALFVFLRSSARISAVALVVGPVVLAGVAHLVFRLNYYRESLPNTYALKIEGIPLSIRVPRGLVVLAQNATLQLVVPLVLTAAFIITSRRGRKLPLGTGLLLGILASQALYVVYIGGDSYDSYFADRYLAPVVPFLFILATLGALELARSSPRILVATGGLIVAAGLFDASSALPIQLIQIPNIHRWHVGWWTGIVLVVGAGIVLAAPFARRIPPIVAFSALLLVAVLATNAVPLASWYRHNYAAQANDQFAAKVGVALNASTPSTATVGVYGAGNTPFFDHRRSIDLLGYNDRHVATSKPHLNVSFRPGHDKWDYAYSIGKLRPDVVLGLYRPTVADLRDMTTWGYRTDDFGYGLVYYQPGWLNRSRFSAALSQS